MPPECTHDGNISQDLRVVSAIWLACAEHAVLTFIVSFELKLRVLKMNSSSCWDMFMESSSEETADST